MSRAGNDDDKALLLAALLAAKQIPVRFALAGLAADDVAALQSEASANVSAALAKDMPDAFYADFGVARERIAAIDAKHARSDAAYVAAGLAFARRNVAALERAIGPLQSASPQTPVPDTHAFAQASIGGRWTDLDPSLGRLSAGMHLGSTDVTTAGTFPSERKHALRLRVLATFDHPGGKAERAVVDRRVDVADLAGVPIEVAITSNESNPDNLADTQRFDTMTWLGGQREPARSFAFHDSENGTLSGVRLELQSLPANLPPDSAAAIRDTLDLNQAAVATTSNAGNAAAGSIGWWAVDPHSGDLIGRAGNGAGTAATEESLLFYPKRVSMAFTPIGIAINGPQSVEDIEIGIFAGGAGVLD